MSAVFQSIQSFSRDAYLLTFDPYCTRSELVENSQSITMDNSPCTICLEEEPVMVQLNCVEGKPPHVIGYKCFNDSNYDKTCCPFCKTPTEPKMVTILQKLQQNNQADSKGQVEYRPIKGIATDLRPEVKRFLESPLRQKTFAVLNGIHWGCYSAMNAIAQTGLFFGGVVYVSISALTKVTISTVFSPIIMSKFLDNFNHTNNLTLPRQTQIHNPVIDSINSELNTLTHFLSLVVTAHLVGYAFFAAIIIVPISIYTGIIQVSVVVMTIAAFLTKFQNNIPKPSLTPRQIWNNDFEPTISNITFCSYVDASSRTRCEDFRAYHAEALAMTPEQRAELANENTPVNNFERTRLGIGTHGELNAHDFITRQQTAFKDGIVWNLPPIES